MIRLFALLAVGVPLFAQPNAVSLTAMPPPRIVYLTWTDTNKPPATSYNVYRDPNPCTTTPIVNKLTTGITTTGVYDAALPGTYCYAVTAVNSGGESQQSGTVQIAVPIGPYDDLGVGTGIIKVGAGITPVTLSVDTAVIGMLNVGPTVPDSCITSNQVFLNTYTNPAGVMTIFSIWICNPQTHKYVKPLLYKQAQ